VPAFQASILFAFVTTRLRAWLFTAGASRLVPLPARPQQMAVDDFQTSPEEAAQW